MKPFQEQLPARAHMIQCKSGVMWLRVMGSLSELGFRQTLEEVSRSRKRPRVGNGTHCVLSDEVTYSSFGLQFSPDTELETRPASLKWYWMSMSFPD